MPIESPVGFLTTLEETVALARRTAGPLEAVFKTPVLLVVAPVEAWVEITAVRTAVDPKTAENISVTMLPTLVFRIERPADRSRVTIGRAAGCDLVMPFAAMSKQHGYFEEAGGTWSVGDTASKNGTYVDGVKVLKGSTIALRDGATLRFGDVTARFLFPASFCGDLRRRLTPR